MQNSVLPTEFDYLDEKQTLERIAEQVQFIDKLREHKKETLQERNQEIKDAELVKQKLLGHLGTLRVQRLEAVATDLLEEEDEEENNGSAQEPVLVTASF